MSVSSDKSYPKPYICPYCHETNPQKNMRPTKDKVRLRTHITKKHPDHINDIEKVINQCRVDYLTSKSKDNSIKSTISDVTSGDHSDHEIPTSVPSASTTIPSVLIPIATASRAISPKPTRKVKKSVSSDQIESVRFANHVLTALLLETIKQLHQESTDTSTDVDDILNSSVNIKKRLESTLELMNTC